MFYPGEVLTHSLVRRPVSLEALHTIGITDIKGEQSALYHCLAFWCWLIQCQQKHFGILIYMNGFFLSFFNFHSCRWGSSLINVGRVLLVHHMSAKLYSNIFPTPQMSGAEGGGPEIILWWNPYIFCYIGLHAKGCPWNISSCDAQLKEWHCHFVCLSAS
jgi:hypothetical protein